MICMYAKIGGLLKPIAVCGDGLMPVSHPCKTGAKADAQIATAFASWKGERPLLFCGRDDDRLATDIIQTAHSKGYHVLETWHGDDLCEDDDDSKHRVYSRLYHSLPEKTVLLITNVEHIDPPGRAALADLYKEKRSESPPKIICTCDDYHTPSMKTRMHALIPEKQVVRLTNVSLKPPAWSSWKDQWSKKPWECVKRVRTRPKKPCARQEEADQLLRENPAVFSTLWTNAYSLQPILSNDKEKPYAMAATVADHFSTCGLLRNLAEWKRKKYSDDDDPQVTHRPGNDEYTCSLGMGLACRTAPTDLKTTMYINEKPAATKPLDYFPTNKKQRLNYSGFYSIERTKDKKTSKSMSLSFHPRFKHATAEFDDLGDDRIVITSI